MLTVRPEIELLLSCARTRGETEAARDIAALLELDIDWTYLLDQALSHGISPLLAHGLLGIPGDGVPADIRDALRRHLDDNRERARQLTAVVFELLDAFAARGIAAIPFRGPILAAMAYGDVGLRRAGDLDFLVRDEQVSALLGVLVQHGFRDATQHRPRHRSRTPSAFLRERDGVVVELHQAAAPWTMAVSHDHEALWRRAASITVLGRLLLALAPEDLLLALCIHGSTREWSQLRWICDLERLIDRQPGMDLDACVCRARAQGSARMLLLGLGLAGRLFDARLPASVCRALDADRRARDLVSQIGDGLLRDDAPARSSSRLTRFRARIRMRERLRDRARCVVRTVAASIVSRRRPLPSPFRLPGPSQPGEPGQPATVERYGYIRAAARQLLSRPGGRRSRPPCRITLEPLLKYNEVLRSEEDVAQAITRLGWQHPFNRAKTWDLLRAVHYIARFVPQRDSPILDAGCAHSPVVDVLHANGYHALFGCDLADRGIASVPRFEFRRASLCATPYPDAQFAAVTCISVVEHGVAAVEFFREMARILRPDGHLLMSTDYFEPKISTDGVDRSITLGLPWIIFDHAEAETFVAEGARHGFRLYEPVDWTCRDPVVQWGGRAYTFLFLAFRHGGS